MKNAKLMTIVLATVLVSLIAAVGFAGDKEAVVYTVTTMADDVTKVQGEEITVEGTIVGACKSGCKMWIADGQYKEGDLFTLVRAKDDAFKFDTKKNGAKVQMTGFVVAKYKDYCGDAAEGKHDDAADHADHADHADNDEHAKNAEYTDTKEVAGSCAAPVNVETATKGELEEMTFFATTVKYLD